MGRGLSGGGRTAHGFHLSVLYRRCPLSINDEVVAHNTMQGRNGASIDTGMSGCCDARYIIDHAVLTAEALVDEPTQSAVSGRLVVIIIEVVPTHLVDYDTDNEFRSVDFGAGVESEHEEQQSPHTSVQGGRGDGDE